MQRPFASQADQAATALTSAIIPRAENISVSADVGLQWENHETKKRLQASFCLIEMRSISEMEALIKPSVYWLMLGQVGTIQGSQPTLRLSARVVLSKLLQTQQVQKQTNEINLGP